MTYPPDMSRFSTNRTTVAGMTVRFFMERRQAIAEANVLTTATNEQHNAVGAYLDETNESHAGYLIENVVQKTFRDTEGILFRDTEGTLAAEVLSVLRIRR